MKTRSAKKVMILLTAVLFSIGAASVAIAASAKGGVDIACPLIDNTTLAKLDLTQAQMAKIHSLCDQHIQPAQVQSRAQSQFDREGLEIIKNSRNHLYGGE